MKIQPIYHRGNRRQPIFLDDLDYARFKAMNYSGVRLYTWKQMLNHFHLLVETPDGHLSEFMQRLLTRYAMYFNRRHDQVGHVFQGRYGARLCDKESYFKELVRYIQLNVYRIAGTPLAEMGSWKWSSHRYLMMPESQWPDRLRTAFEELLGRFADDLLKARHVYAKFPADGLKNGAWEKFYQPKGEFVGDEALWKKVSVELEKKYGNKRTVVVKILRTSKSKADFGRPIIRQGNFPREDGVRN